MGDPSVEMTVVGRCLVARATGVTDFVTQLVVRARFKDLMAHGSPFIVLACPGCPFATLPS